MYNDFFDQNEPSFCYKYLDSPTSGKSMKKVHYYRTRVARNGNKDEFLFFIFFLNIQLYLPFPEKIHISELFDFRVLTFTKVITIDNSVFNLVKPHFFFFLNQTIIHSCTISLK